MKKTITLGVVCLARKTYDFEAAFDIYKSAMATLKTYEAIEWEFIPELVIEVAEAKEAAKKLVEKHLDGLIIITGTFHLGHLALELKSRLAVPTLLWAFKELPYNGGKIRLNSVCGVNLNASNLFKAGYDDVSCVVADEPDMDWIEAVRMGAALKSSHIGIIGYRADGFFNLDVTEMNIYRQTGILVDHYELVEVINMDVSDEETAEYIPIVKSFNCCGINEEQAEKVAKLCVKFEKFMQQYGLTGLAVRCWPEFANLYGISPCAAMSILQAKGYLLACEGDIEGLLSMVICDAIGGDRPFLADLSQVDFDENKALLWHCGVAPYTLWDEKCEKSLDTYFAGGRGVTVGFAMKPGRINLVRIDSARGKTRLFFEGGKAVPIEKLLTGTYAKVEFDKKVDEVLDIVTSTGVAHHLAMIYDEKRNAFKIFAKNMGYEWIE